MLKILTQKILTGFMSDIIETERYRAFALFYSNFSAMEGKG